MSRNPNLTSSGNQVLEPGLLLDSRRALYLEEFSTLVVSDVHLGYPWVHRQQGQLLPLGPPHRALEVLVELQREYQPTQIVFLGDLVHGAAPLPALEEELRELVSQLSARSKLLLLLGNHDQNLPEWLQQLDLPLPAQTESFLGPHLLLHGHSEPLSKPKAGGGRIIIGHEHPAIDLDDGVTTALKCPCFLVDDTLLVLPAFSPWAPGYPARARVFLGPLAQRARFHHAAAILGPRLLSVPIG